MQKTPKKHGFMAIPAAVLLLATATLLASGCAARPPSTAEAFLTQVYTAQDTEEFSLESGDMEQIQQTLDAHAETLRPTATEDCIEMMALNRTLGAVQRAAAFAGCATEVTAVDLSIETASDGQKVARYTVALRLTYGDGTQSEASFSGKLVLAGEDGAEKVSVFTPVEPLPEDAFAQ